MGGGGSPPPPPPSGAGLAEAQKTANLDTAIAQAYIGATDQITPYGDLRYTRTGTEYVGDRPVPRFTATQTMSPEQRRLYDSQTGLQQGALDLAGAQIGRVNSAVSAAFPRTAPQFYDDARNALLARNREDAAEARDRLTTQLYNQGVREGSEAWNNAFQPLNRSMVDAGNQATLAAGGLADQELARALQIRQLPLQEYQALLGFGGTTTAPNYATPINAQIAPTDVVTPMMQEYQGRLSGWQTEQQSRNALLGGLFGLAGAGLGGWSRNWGRPITGSLLGGLSQSPRS